MRNSFIQWLCAKAEIDQRIVLLTADLGYSVVEPFSTTYPDRFINVGVAEQNMVGIAAGLAAEGYRPFTYSIGIFPTFRCAEQLRNDVDYHNLPVCTCTVGSGVAYGSLGYSHHAVQDLALMRSLPNTLIATPSDSFEVEAILNWHLDQETPTYLRLHKSGEPEIHSYRPTLDLGTPLNINDTTHHGDVCIVAIGFLAYHAKKILAELNVSINLYSLPLWGQKSSNKFCMAVSNYQTIITLEDHLLAGGLASWVMESLAIKRLPNKVIPIVLSSSSVGQVASEATLLKPLLQELRDLLQKLAT